MKFNMDTITTQKVKPNVKSPIQGTNYSTNVNLENLFTGKPTNYIWRI